MNIEEVRDLCLSLPFAEECTPFVNCHSDVVVFKVAGKMFAMLAVDTSRRVFLKCDPDYAVTLRDKYIGVIEPAWHCNKKYWNQVRYDSFQISKDFLFSLIRHSYDEVLKKMSRSQRENIS